MTFFPLVTICWLFNNPKSSFWRALTKQNTVEKNCIISQAQNMTALSLKCFNWNTLFTGNKQGTALPSAKTQPRPIADSSVTICNRMWTLRVISW